MSHKSKKRFAFNGVPRFLHCLILKYVDFRERLFLLTSTKAIRREILDQGAFPQNVTHVAVDFAKFRLWSGKVMDENLFIEVYAWDHECFSQRKYRSRILESPSPNIDPHRLAPCGWQVFQAVTTKGLAFRNEPQEIRKSATADGFKFLPNAAHLHQLDVEYESIPENAVDAFFGNLPAKFCKKPFGSLPPITRKFADSFRKHNSECQYVMMRSIYAEMLWETLSRTRIQILELWSNNYEEMQAMIDETLKNGLPLGDPDAQMVSSLRGRNRQETIDNFVKLVHFFTTSENVHEVCATLAGRFDNVCASPGEHIDEHYFLKNIAGNDHLWKLEATARDTVIYVARARSQ